MPTEKFFNVLSEIKHSIDKNYLVKEKLKFSFNKNIIFLQP